ncbi:MAG TPA: class I SAM-dependent methyltransferase [Verrucomicrobiae bacterium]|nr:class I SAM-dependent methyltransferase [Verrucomicrobiae bacterium]
MANPYYSPGEQRTAKVQELFARIAPRYDLINDLQSFGLHRYWKRKVISMARPTRGEYGLDVCCGTGDLTFAFAGRGIHAVGLDFSGAMLQVAGHRAHRRAEKGHRLEPAAGHAASQGARETPLFVRADAQRIPFRDNSFDIVSVGYGLRNLADWKTGLAELHRLLRRGGRLLVLDFGKPDNAVWRSLYFSYLRLFVPILGRTFCGSADAYAYILESLRHYPAQHGVAAVMRDLGFTRVGIVTFLGGVMTINYGEKPPS